MHNAFPARGTDAWYAMIEQLAMKHRTDIQRLQARQPQSPDNVGDPANDPDAEAPTTGT